MKINAKDVALDAGAGAGSGPGGFGPYEVLEEIGRGAHGLVYLCRDRRTGEPAAVKTVEGLRAERLQSLRREIHALSRISHPGIAQILAHGVEGGRPWCAVELIAGGDLWDHCRRLWAPDGAARPAGRGRARRPRIPREALGEILTLLRRLCSPLAYLHGEGLVHRDLKPRNVLLRNEEGGMRKEQRQGTELIPRSSFLIPVLVDFGLVSELDGPVARAGLELGGTAVGTYAYAAPEQLEGRLVDARADLYAFGSMLYALLTGRPPFETLEEVRDPALPPGPPSRHVAGLPEALDELVLELLAKEPALRIGHADAVAAVLAGLGASNGGPPAPAPRLSLYRPALTGRAELLQRLGARLSERLRAGRGALVFLAGESGIGKTRLAVEVASRFRAQGLEVLAGECVPPVGERGAGSGAEAGRSAAGAGAPLQPLLAPLRAVADRCREGGEAETERLLGPRGKVLARYEPALRGLPGLERWPEPEELPPREARLRLYRALAQTLAAYADGQPLLLVLDDLHWADELTLGFLELVARAGLFERTRLVVLATFRTEEAGPALAACRALEPAETISLGRLDAESAGAMAADMLGLRLAPAGLGRAIFGHTEGNPFFVAEYLRLALQEGLLSRDLLGRWQAAGGSTAEAWAALPLPGSVRELVTRRLAGLPAAALRLVRAAAVAGRQASSALLQRLAALPDAELLEATAEAVRRQVLEDAGQDLLRFVHDQIRELAYAGLDAPQRVALHRAAAEAIEALHAGELDALQAELGRHWEAAGERDRARACYLAAARLAVAGHALAKAQELYRAALALADAPGAERIEARHELGLRVLSRRGLKDDALAELALALDEARQLGLRLLEARCLHALGNVAYDLGRIDEARGRHEAALGLYRELGEPVREADMLGALAHADVLQGRLHEAEQRHAQALELYRAHGHRAGVAESLGALGLVAWHRSRMDETLRHIGEALEIDRELGNRRAEAIRLGHLGGLRWSQGRLAESRQLYGRALELHREIGDRRLEGLSLGNLGATAWTEGRLDEARELYEQALAIHREVGDRRSEGLQSTNLACVHRDQGRPDEARKLFAHALTVHREVGNRLDEEDTLVQMAILARRAGEDLEAAGALLDQAETLARALDSPLRLARCLCERGHGRLARGLPAREPLEQAERLAAEGGASPESEYGLLVARLRRAVEAAEAGCELLRGELAEDVPEGFRLWLESRQP